MPGTKWVGPNPNDTWEEREKRRQKRDRTYWNADKFLEDVRADELPELFFLDEDVFRELAGRIIIEPQTAKLISEMGIIILLKADKGLEVDGLVELATQVASEQDG